MGCCQAREGHALEYADDSLHVIVVKDQKQRSQQGLPSDKTAYRPRQPHPLLQQTQPPEQEPQQQQEQQEQELVEKNQDDNEGKEESKEEQVVHNNTTTTAGDETKKLLYHTANHNDTLSERDLELLKRQREVGMEEHEDVDEDNNHDANEKAKS